MRIDGKRNHPVGIDEITDEDLFRFREFVGIATESDEPADKACWLWLGATDEKGYGKFWHAGKVVWAHRFSCAAFNGFDIAGWEVGHSCNNPNCVNPAHLSPTTKAANVAERNVRYARNRRQKAV